MKITLKSLEAFQAIITTGSATKAAELLNMTQPGISRLLAQLEDEVGYNLFYREKGRLFASDEAVALANEVELTLASAQRIELLAKNIFSANYGTLKIVAPNSFTTGPLTKVITAFSLEHPDIKFQLLSHSPARAQELIANRAVDCGFIQLPASAPGLDCALLFSSEITCVVPSDHPLSQQTSIAVSELAKTPLILLGKGRRTRERIDLAFRQAKFIPNVKIETHSVATACAMAQAGLGIALVNHELVKQFDSDQHKCIPLSPSISIDYGFATSAHVPMNRLTQTFFSFCKKTI